MALSTLKDFEASSRRSLKTYNFVHFDVYCCQEEKVGVVTDILVDKDGKCQYLVIALIKEMAGKQVLLPYEQSQADQTAQRIYATGLNQEQIANLKNFNLSDPSMTENTVDDQVTVTNYPL
ncbi:MAG: PRC-barrel domain-containing protein [Cyanobacteriota bacterium]